MSEIRPAMSAEEWERVWDGEYPPSDYARAAAYLYGQPFGFTWADVDRLRDRAQPRPHNWLTTDQQRALRDLADRIAALLPPRE